MKGIKASGVYLFAIVFIISLQNSIPGYSQSIELLFAKGKDANLKEEYNTAIYYFNQVLRVDSSSAEVYTERGLAYHNLGYLSKSLNDYYKAIELDKNLPDSFFGIASVCEIQRDYHRAIHYYTQAIKKALLLGDTEYAATGYMMRGIMCGKVGNNQGKIEDLKESARLGNTIASDLLRLHESVYK